MLRVPIYRLIRGYRSLQFFEGWNQMVSWKPNWQESTAGGYIPLEAMPPGSGQQNWALKKLRLNSDD